MMKIFMMVTSLMYLAYFLKNFKLISHNFIFLTLMLMIMNFNNMIYGTKIYYMFIMDNISVNLMLLSCWIIALSILTNYKFLFKTSSMKFLILMFLLLMILLLCFSTTNLLLFYIFFEMSLIPLMFLIMGWGSQIDRIQATMYMLFYTLSGSLPFLLMLIMLMNKSQTIMMNILMINNLNYLNFNSLLIFFSIMMAFLIKLPMYMAHTWLPKAHVEAPISGSMILAGIMLKLGSYGIYRMSLIFINLMIKFNYIFISLSLMGSIYASFICISQTDCKMIVAYSSVVHMNMMIASLFTLNLWSFYGNLWMMIAHGLCSSCMFCLVNFNYERTFSRNLIMNKGLVNIFPSLCMWWFLICSNNFATPPSLNLFSEVTLITGLVSWLTFNLIYIFIITFISTYYSIYIFSFVHHGPPPMNNIMNINVKEFSIIILHWIPLNILFTNLFLFN